MSKTTGMQRTPSGVTFHMADGTSKTYTHATPEAESAIKYFAAMQCLDKLGLRPDPVTVPVVYPDEDNDSFKGGHISDVRVTRGVALYPRSLAKKKPSWAQRAWEVFSDPYLIAWAFCAVVSWAAVINHLWRTTP